MRTISYEISFIDIQKSFFFFYKHNKNLIIR